MINVSKLTLITIVPYYCHCAASAECPVLPGLLPIENLISFNCISVLVFPYVTLNAKCKLLKMPSELVILQVVRHVYIYLNSLKVLTIMHHYHSKSTVMK